MGLRKEEIDHIRKLIGKEGNLGKKERESRDFIKELLLVIPISSIYYPGCGGDFFLDDFFKPHQITYLDRTPLRKDVIKGDFGCTPDIPDGLFDAVLLQDIHQNKSQMNELLRTLRTRGILIQGLYKCGLEGPECITLDQLRNTPKLKEKQLVLSTHPFRTFAKI